MTTPEREGSVKEAITALEETRWMADGMMGQGSMAEWAKTPEGLNHERVMRALEALRSLASAPVATAGEEEVEAIRRTVADGDGSWRDKTLLSAIDTLTAECGRLTKENAEIRELHGKALEESGASWASEARLREALERINQWDIVSSHETPAQMARAALAPPVASEEREGAGKWP